MSTHTTNAIVQTAKLVTLGDAIRAKAGLSNEMTLDEMATAVANIETGGTYQSKTVSPSTSQQTVSPDSGYDALSSVTVNAMPTGTAGTPTASKGAVSNHSITVTPSVTNVTGYITGGTKTGTAVTVSASELVSGTKNITSSGTTDVTNYANVSVPSGSASTPATTITATPTISVSSSGLITASVSKTQSVTPSVSAGYVASGTAGTVTVSGSNTSQLTAKSAQTYTPTTSNQTIASGQYLTGVQTILGDANLIAENIKKDVVIFGITGTYEGDAPSNYTVTISLTNPIEPSDFYSCDIYQLTPDTLIGQITSPTGSTSVSVDVGHDIEIGLSGGSVSCDPSGVTCSTGITMISHSWSGPLVFSVSESGTITLDGINWYDD